MSPWPATSSPELVKAKTGGKMIIKTFHGGQLGSGKETFEAVKTGFLDVAVDSYANMYTLTPAFEPFHLPYIFESRNQQLAAFKNQNIRGRVDATLKKVGLKWLLALEYAPRQIGTSKKAIKVPGDLAGLKLRASRSPAGDSHPQGMGRHRRDHRLAFGSRSPAHGPGGRRDGGL